MCESVLPTKLCYEFEKYQSIYEMFYEVVLQYAIEMQAPSVDKALLEEKGSLDMGFNILVAGLSKKPDDKENYLKSNTKVIGLPSVGYAMTEKLKDMSVETLFDVRRIMLTDLQSKLGAKMGQTLFYFSRGLDDHALTRHKQRQSIGAQVNWGVRFENEVNGKLFVKRLVKEVSDQLVKHGLKGKRVTIKILKRNYDAAAKVSKQLDHRQIDSYLKSSTLIDYTNDILIIFKCVDSMLNEFRFSYSDIELLGIQVTKLNNHILAPDQGRLGFESTNSKTNLATTTVEGKAELTVDGNVYKELPESVQHELQSNYNINYQYNDSPQELPPWSQLDPTALLALPKEMREQVVQAYGNRRLPLHMDGLEYDVNVWNALPDDVRTDLLEERRRNIHTDQKQEQEKTVVSVSEEILEEEPGLNECTDIKEIRILLRDWVSLYKQGPEPQDIHSILTLLGDLIQHSNLEKARLVIVYLDYLTRNVNNWKLHVIHIKEAVQREVCLKYGYPLAFYQ